MTKMIKKRASTAMSILLVLALMLGCISSFTPRLAYADSADNLVSGTYSKSFDMGMMTMDVDAKIDANGKTFEVYRGDNRRSGGTYSFDPATGVYTVEYTDEALTGKTSTFICNDDSTGITFTTPIYMGSVAMNITDDDGNFQPYTMTREASASTEADAIKTGWYKFTDESFTTSYDQGDTHNHMAYFKFDADAKTMQTFESTYGDAKGTGTYEYDEASGVYTVTYTADTTSGVGKTATFTYDSEADTVTFTSPIYYGVAQLALTKDDVFVPYTAFATEDPTGSFQQHPSIPEVDTEGKKLGSGNVENTFGMAWDNYSVKVAVTLDDSGKLTNIELVDFPGLAESRLNACIRFANNAINGTDSSNGIKDQLSGKTASEINAMDSIDAVSSATGSSNGIFAAVQNALQTIEFKEGTYTGIYEKAAMSSTIVYNITAAFADGNYSYDVYFEMSGEKYEDETAYGTYTIDGNTLTFTGGPLTSAEITVEGKLDITGKMSSFAFNSATTEIVWTSADGPKTAPVELADVYGAKSTAANGTEYVYQLSFDKDNETYELIIAYKMGGTVYKEKETGKYTVEENKIQLSEGKLDVVVMEITGRNVDDKECTVANDGSFLMARHASFMAMSMGKDPVELTFTPGAPQMPVDDAAVELEDVYGAVSTAANGIEYVYQLSFDQENNTYEIITAYKLDGSVYKETETGSYSLEDGKISFTDSKLTVPHMEVADRVIDDAAAELDSDGNVVKSQYASFMARTMGKDPVELTFTPGTPTMPVDDPVEEPDVFEDLLESGTYELTADSYPADSMMKLAADVVIDTEKGTIQVWRTMANSEYSMRSEGTITFDEETGEYTASFTTPEGKSTTFTYDAEKKAVTFTSALWFGSVAMNTTDEEGNFQTYTATLKAEDESCEDLLESGTYELTADSYPADSMMKLAADVVIDTEKGTIQVWRTMANGEYSMRSEGAITFDEETGEYTASFTTPEGKSTTFTYDAEKKAVTFTSALWFGSVAMNTTDEEGNFQTYTATLKSDSADEPTEEPADDQKTEGPKEDSKTEEPAENPADDKNTENTDEEADAAVKVISVKNKNGSDVKFELNNLNNVSELTAKTIVDITDDISDITEVEKILWQKDVTVPAGTEFPATMKFSIAKEYQDKDLYIYHFNGTAWEFIGKGKGAEISAEFDSLSPVGVASISKSTPAPAPITDTPDVPATGDDANMIPWLCAMIAALAIALHLLKKRVLDK